jgi:hypothetical protein
MSEPKRNHNPYHLPGHRVANIRFADREARCQCGAVVTAEDDESREVRDASLALAFHEHRREMARVEGHDWLHAQ